MSELLVAKDIKKVFQRKGAETLEILKGIHLQVHEGDKIAVLGRSGAGKSTFLHILGTLEKPTSGEVTFKGKDIFRLSEEELAHFRNKSLGFIFQFHYLMLEFTALENVMMPGLIAGWPRKKAIEAATDYLDRVGLSKRLDHKPNQLSGGEQQRVAIARALVMHPKLLLTDEMTGNLDPHTGAQVFELVQKLHSDLKMALISVTHDEGLAKSYPKILTLDDGYLT